MNYEERVIEFDKIKELWLAYALTESAKEKIRNAVVNDKVPKNLDEYYK